MGFIETHRLNAAAKRYAIRLPAQLLQDYGASETYTVPQIIAAATRAKLPPEYMALAHAAYLPREVFDTEIDCIYSYDFLREKFKSHLRRFPSQQIGTVGESADAVAGGYAGGDGGGGSGW
jgi:hypothetical protein